MSLSDDAVRGVSPSTEAVLPEPTPLPVYPEVVDYLDMIRPYLPRPYGPPIGHPDNPYSLVIPAHLEERFNIEQGITAQEYVDKNWLVSVKVEVVR